MFGNNYEMNNTQYVYFAAFLDEPSKAKLLRKYGQYFPNLYAHHMTILFGNLSNWQKFGYELGEHITLNLIGQVIKDGVQVGVVSNGRSDNKHPHITISTDIGIKPFVSNRVLSNVGNSELFGDSIMVSARIGFFEKNNMIVYESI